MLWRCDLLPSPPRFTRLPPTSPRETTDEVIRDSGARSELTEPQPLREREGEPE